jgi:hypothetical protein
MTYQRVWNKSNMTGAWRGAGTAYSSRTQHLASFFHISVWFGLSILLKYMSSLIWLHIVMCGAIFSFKQYSIHLYFHLFWAASVACPPRMLFIVGSNPGRVKPDYKIGIWCFSAKHATLRRKSKDWLARNQNNVSEWSDMSIRGLLFQWVALKKSN